MPDERRLVDILVREGLIASGAAGALDEVGAARRPVEVAVRERDIDEVALVAAIRRHVKVPLADPAKVEVEVDAIRVLSRDVCRRLKVLPLQVSGWPDDGLVLELAMADPTDGRAIAEVEEFAACRVAPALMTLSAIEELVESAYGALVTEVMRRDPRAKTVPAEDVAPAEPPSESGAPLAARHQALLELMLEKQLIREDEYEAAVSRVLARDRTEKPR
jgi:hypothetical protein